MTMLLATLCYPVAGPRRYVTVMKPARSCRRDKHLWRDSESAIFGLPRANGNRRPVGARWRISVQWAGGRRWRLTSAGLGPVTAKLCVLATTAALRNSSRPDQLFIIRIDKLSSGNIATFLPDHRCPQLPVRHGPIESEGVGQRHAMGEFEMTKPS
jgi:hypothetical protein